MSKHHHHPHEGHSQGNPPAGRPLRHTWFFYVAGFFLMLALIGFILEHNFNFQSAPAVPPPSTPAAAGK